MKAIAVAILLGLIIHKDDPPGEISWQFLLHAFGLEALFFWFLYTGQ